MRGQKSKYCTLPAASGGRTPAELHPECHGTGFGLTSAIYDDSVLAITVPDWPRGFTPFQTWICPNTPSGIRPGHRRRLVQADPNFESQIFNLHAPG